MTINVQNVSKCSFCQHELNNNNCVDATITRTLNQDKGDVQPRFTHDSKYRVSVDIRVNNLNCVFGKMQHSTMYIDIDR